MAAAAGAEAVIRGNFAAPDGLGTSQIRVFLSSTFTDTVKERDVILGRAVPRVKEYAKRLGYEFSPASMQWGVTKAHANNHQHAELCIAELRDCMETSEGVSFVSLLGQKYGFRPFPARIPASEFEQIRAAVSASDESTALLDRFFERDDNCVPPMFVLVPITRHFPDYGNDTKPEASREASSGWWLAFAQLQQTLREGARAANFPQDVQHKFHHSVTELETIVGLSGKNLDDTAVWFRRTFAALDNDDSRLSDPATPLFTDILPSKVLDTESRMLLSKQKNDLMAPRMKHIKEYRLATWSPTLGLDPSMPEHKEYLDNLSRDFESAMIASIDKAHSRASTLRSDLVYVEAAHHAAICRERCKGFHSRKDVLDKIKTYIETPADQTLPPLVVHGESGSGKTSVMAKAAMESSIRNSSRATVLRFIGTSANSSAIAQLLRSLCQHLCRIYAPAAESSVAHSLADLIKEFEERLGLASEAAPIVIFLDSLDQLAPEGGARQLRWLPMKPLPPGVRIVVSTLPDEKYTCFPVLRHALKANPELFVQVPRLDPATDGELIVSDWLASVGRSLTKDQRDVLMTACRGCPLPLFLRLAMERALLWSSSTPQSEVRVSADVRSLINDLFIDLERDHGRLYISRALGLITAAKRGLSGDEIEDLISCDDQVLDQIFEYWMPPFRRIPPLLWARVRRKLGSFFAERGSGSANVLAWHHRQFLEAAEVRYLSDAAEVRERHSALADLFLGTWAGDAEKPFENSPEKMARFGLKKHDKASRYVALQPLVFGTDDVASDRTGGSTVRLNTRKLDELPFQLTRAGRFDELVACCLCNFDFLLCKMHAFGAYEVLLDFDSYLDNPASAHHALFPAVALIASAIRMSPSDPEQLALQLVGRLESLKDRHACIKSLLEQARASKLLGVPVFFPTNRCLSGPGGALQQTFGHPDKLWTVAVSRDGRVLLTGCDDRKAYVWDTKTGEQIIRLEDQDWMVRAVAISDDSSVAATSAFSGQVMVWDTQTWTKLKEFFPTGEESTYCESLKFVPGSNRLLGGSYSECVAKVFDLETTSAVKTFRTAAIVGDSSVKASELAFTPDGRHVVVAMKDSICVFVYETEATLYPPVAVGATCNSVCVSPNGATIFAGSNKVEALKLANGSSLWQCALGTSGYPMIETVAANDKFVAAGSSEGKIFMLSHAGQLVRTIEAHSDWIKSLVLFRNNVFSVSQDRTARIFDFTVDAQMDRAPEKHASKVEYTAVTSTHVFSSDESGSSVLKWDIASGELVGDPWPGPRELYLSPDGKTFVSSTGVYDMSGVRVREFVRRGAYGYSMAILPDQTGALFSAIGMSPDSTVYFLDFRTSAIKATAMTHGGLVRSVRMSPNGDRVFSVGDDARAKTWEWPSQKLLFEGKLSKIGISGAVSPDGRFGLSTSKDGSAKLWDLATGAELFKLAHMVADGHNFNRIVPATCFTSDGKYAITGGQDRHLKFWDVATGALSATITLDSSIQFCASGPQGVIALGLGGGEVAILKPAVPMTVIPQPVTPDMVAFEPSSSTAGGCCLLS